MSECWYGDVRDFHERFGVAIGASPAIPDAGTVQLRRALVREEIAETFKAMDDFDLAGIADGVVDSIYVLLGLLVSYGIDPRPVWDAVHAANMSKVGGTTRTDGKIQKPPGWVAPDVSAIIEAQQQQS